QHMVAKYDLNANGLSKDEIAKMSLTGKRAVDLAKALKGAVVDDSDVKLTSSKLGTEIAKHAKDAWYMSESDYHPEFFAQPFPAGHDLTGHNVMTALNGPLSKLFEARNGNLSAFTFEQYSAKDAKAFIKDLSAPPEDGDALYTKSAKAFGEITALLGANLTDVKVFKIGPKDGTRLGSDMGLYAQVVVGRTSDGKVAGIILGDVET
ncbi:MAG: nuclease A inhibitor family protein, partial [Myxococcales bacterium]|nr:nuclease A inhibitor family protein [Myxococcales bacterium]